MAVIKCKECGGQVSTKAKACPSCGTVPRKKTSIVIWFALFFILFTCYLLMNAPPVKKSPVSNVYTESSNTTIPQPIVEKKIMPSVYTPVWGTSFSKDEMTGEFSAYANSPVTYPSTEMDFPYGNVSSWLGIGCDKNSEWIYLGFSDSPNLLDTETHDGFNLINTRIKWDEIVKSIQLTQEWSSKFIHFRNKREAITRVAGADHTRSFFTRYL